MSSLRRYACQRLAVSLISPCLSSQAPVLQHVKPTSLTQTLSTAQQPGIPGIAHAVYPSPELPTAPPETRPPDVYPPSPKALLLALHRIQAGTYTSASHGGLLSSLAAKPSEKGKIVSKLEASLNATRPVRIEYSLLVARYLHLIYPLLRTDVARASDLDNALLQVFDDDALAYLSKRGYSAGDVMAWAWVLATPDAHLAVMRYQILAEEAPVPMFILMFLLRRVDIDEPSFKFLLEQCRRLLNSMVQDEPSPLSKDSESGTSSIPVQSIKGDSALAMTILVRLTNLARNIAPRTLANIAEMFTSTFTCLTATKDLDQLGPKKARRVTELYNKFIQRLAGWCRVEPYHSAKLQQKAVFHILREMETFNPPLPVNKASYQAITQILLAAKMTKAERQWDSFKAVSWPPWKEDKLGIDAEKTEGSKSKAMESMAHMQQAGYRFAEWDRAASVVAGWDTDGTPTIQKRTRLPDPSWQRLEGNESPSEPLVWAARIRATRTLREAWACYVSSQQQNVPLTEQIIYEIVEKLISSERTRGQINQQAEFESKATAAFAPSDGGKEVYPEPTSPRDLIYVPSEPPALPEFLQQTFSQDFPLPDKVLVLILRHSSSLKQGLDYIDHSTLTKGQIYALFNPSSQQSRERVDALSSIHDAMFSAVIRFLCRCASHSTVDGIPDRMEALNAMFPILLPRYSDLEPNQGRALAHAIFLMEQRRPRYMSAWHNLLKAVAIGSRPFHNFHRLGLAPGVNRVFAWEETLRLVEYMNVNSVALDLRCIQLMCNGFVGLAQTLHLHPGAVKAGRRVASHFQFPGPSPAIPDRLLTTQTAEEMVEHGLAQLRLQVNRFLPLYREQQATGAASVDDATPTLSRRALIPSPSILHSLIRAFGRGRDRETIVAILRILQTEGHELRRVTNERRGGRRMLRRAVVACRVFLEHDPMALREEEAGCSQADQLAHPLVQEARRLMDETEVMAPWPSDEEVDAYIQHEMLYNFYHDEE
ncbi:hypothetical protein MGYG_02625 [Nannizzia gypsea CBS 118893]|uniref:Uncharacterized protein n=1 Tax=Arthroderma gypseum (strain ATCC MYA-4604 / CBS 118893) TaxID=535722 RepID=E4UNK3_ARTGP|nr:hypothetical protein MGYG_02625 [Nannizzia gypsea CBS 118893]EFQ99611.1 hypothetical protein MGYG_02625 [Nannizzia gypsea CBS 118893]